MVAVNTDSISPQTTAVNAIASRARNLPEYMTLISESVARLPFTMASPLARSEQACAEANYKEALIHLLDFFEMSVQWLNSYLISRLAPLAARTDQQAACKALVRAVNIIDTKRPLSFGDHVNELLQPLVFAAGHILHDDPLVQGLTAHIVNPHFNILSGSAKQCGVVKVRNDFKGHSTSLAQEFYRQALDSLAIHLKAMLQGLRPLHAYTFCAVDVRGRLLDARSCEENLAPSDAGVSAQPGHYYAIDTAGYSCDLWPLVMVNNNGYICLFQTLKDENVCYESSSQLVHRFETQDYNSAFDDCLRRVVPSFDVAREFNWQEILDATATHTQTYMLQVQKEKKFSAELFVDRRELSVLFEAFLTDSSHTLLPLPGEAGQGKTNQLCHWASWLLEQGRSVLIFNCAELSVCGLPVALRSIFTSSRRRNINRVMEAIHNKAREARQIICFLFDALNECLSYVASDGTTTPDGPSALMRDIIALLVRPDRPCFKVVVTCRSFTWKNCILPTVRPDVALCFQSDSNEAYNIGGFSAEETKEAWCIYGKLYQMDSDFDNLDRRILLRLRDPLTLKFACGNNVGKPLPDNPGEFTSIKLFSTMMTDIRCRSFAGRLQCELLDELSDRLFDSYLQGHPMSYISSIALRDAFDDETAPFHRLAKMVYRNGGGLSVAYAELLRNPERTVLKESVRTLPDGERGNVVEFIYERFLEYVMCMSFRRMCSGTPCVADYLRVLAHTEVNVVLLGTLRNSLLIDIVENNSFDILLELIADHGTCLDVMQLTNDVIDVLIRENYEPQLFELQRRMLDAMPADTTLIFRYNSTQRCMADAGTTPELISELRYLGSLLAPVRRLRDTVSVSLTNILCSDYFNENLYLESPLPLVWRLMEDSIIDVSDEACKQIYYLSHRRRTHGGLPLRENLTSRLVREMFSEVQRRSMVANLLSGTRRHRMMRFTETGVRLAVLLIIDACMAPVPDEELAAEMLDRIRCLASYLTLRYTIVRLALPFLQSIMRRQITFQSEYVNNAVEYTSFWDDSVVPAEAAGGCWSRQLLREVIRYVGYYGRIRRGETDGVAEACSFVSLHLAILDAYTRGCSFSYFVLERILVIMGTSEWNNIRPLMLQLLASGRVRNEWSDYSQMSLLYVLYQIEFNSTRPNGEILEIYTREAADWTRRCRGRFRGRNSERANPTGFYKRNVMNWYGVVYCRHTGDGVPHSGDECCAPLFYELIDEAIAADDREMLLHLLDNISEMIADCGLIELPLQLLHHIFAAYDSVVAVRRLDSSYSPNPVHEGQTLVVQAGRVLGIAHRYFPDRTRRFLQSEVVGMRFPGVTAYREEILGNIGDTEKLSDLFTHRFGNFLMWSLLNNEAVAHFSFEAICAAPASRDCFQWYDNVVRILCRHLLNIKV